MNTITLYLPAGNLLGLPAGENTLTPQVLALRLARATGLRATPEEVRAIFLWRGLAECALDALRDQGAVDEVDDTVALFALLQAVAPVFRGAEAFSQETCEQAKAWARSLSPEDRAAMWARGRTLWEQTPSVLQHHEAEALDAVAF